MTVEPSRAPVAKALPTPLGRAFRFSASRPPSVSTPALPLFLFPENIVPVILVGLGHGLLTFAHTLLLRCGVRFAFGSGLCLGFNRLRLYRLGFDGLALNALAFNTFGFDSLLFSAWLFRRNVLGFLIG